MKIKNVNVYGLDNAVRVAKFPMTKDAEEVNSDILNITNTLGAAKIGSGHNNFLKGIIVQFDLTVSIKLWTEAERYHWFEIISSQSTMHSITKFELTSERFNSHVDVRAIELLKDKIALYKKDMSAERYLDVLYNVPVGCNLTAGISTNYLQLKTIYKQRTNHRLTEWLLFCKWIESLPHSEWITNG